MKAKYRVSGRVINRQTRTGIAGIKVEAWDKDLIFDDLLGSAVTDEAGRFSIAFDDSYFREFFDRKPDIFFRLYYRSELAHSTENEVLWNVEAGETEVNIQIEVPVALEPAALERCDNGVRRLLLMPEEAIVRAKERDEKRIVSSLQAYRARQERRPSEATAFRRSGVLPHPVFGAVVLDKLKPRPLKVRAIVDFGGNADDLAAMGIVVGSHVQSLFTVTATAAQLAHLTAQAATRRIRLPRLLFPDLDDSVPTAEVDQIHALGTRGNGTIVGIVDGTLHVRHHAFLDPNPPHNTRVLFLWIQDPDQPAGGALLPGETPEAYFNNNAAHPNSPDFTGLNYGRIYDADAINTALGLANTYGTGAGEIAKAPHAVSAEHGTHVAGIAAGSGHLNNWAAAPINVGAAPLADIVHVTYRWSDPNVQDGIWEDDILNALNFILRVADREGQPVVINNSYSTHIGPHNGNTDFDQARNAMLDSFLGRSLVFTSGNDNDDSGFRQESIVAGNTDDFDMSPNFANQDVWLEVWYQGPDLDFKADCGGQTTGWILPSNDFDGTVNGYDIELDRQTEPVSGYKNLRLYIQNATTDWTIHLRNNGGSEVRYWAWTGAQDSWADLDNPVTDELTLRDTPCARSVLTVGGCDKQVGANPELIGDYSGCGPTLDGRIKPEIVAVGTDVMSADSRTESGYVSMGGTSMAAPLVTGSIALLFENDPDLNQDTVKALLTQTADRTNLDIDPDVAGYDPVERNAYGFGRLRMLAPFQHSLPLVDVDVWVRTADDDYGYQPYPGGCFCHAPEIRVFAGGNETTTLNWGDEHTIQVRVHNLGDTPAVQVKVRLKYTRPWAAPDDWVECQDSANDPVEDEINIPALSYVDHTFTQQWKPELAQLPAGGDEWGDHYCLLVEAENTDDPLLYDDSTAAGKDPWTRNIKGTNNVALRNLHIH